MKVETISLPCHCGQMNTYQNYYLINLDEKPSLLSCILDDSIFKYVCQSCHSESYFHHPIICISKQLKFIIGYQKEAFDLFLKIYKCYESLAHYTIRYCEDWYCFKEKVQIFIHHRDDRLIELYKTKMRQQLQKEYSHPEKLIIYYDHTFQESMVVINEKKEAHFYQFPTQWYYYKKNDPFIAHILHYDTSLVVNHNFYQDLNHLHLFGILATIKTTFFTDVFLVPGYEHPHIHDQVILHYQGGFIQGTILALKVVEVREIPPHTPFIEKVISSNLPNNQKNILSYESETLTLQNLLDYLLNVNIYLLVAPDLLFETLTIENATFGCVYTSKEDAQRNNTSHYQILAVSFLSLISQHSQHLDGYIFSPYSAQFFVVDNAMIQLLKNYQQELIHALN